MVDLCTQERAFGIYMKRPNIGKIVNGVVIISQEEIIASETRIEEINDEISSIEERGTIFSD